MYQFSMCFGGPRSIARVSSARYKPWKEVRAPIDHLIGVYDPGTIPWGVYGRELLRGWFLACIRSLTHCWMVLDFIPRLRKCLRGILTPKKVFTAYERVFTVQAYA